MGCRWQCPAALLSQEDRATIADIGFTDPGCHRTLLPMKPARRSPVRWTLILALALIGIAESGRSAELPEQKPFGPEANNNNPSHYTDGEQVRTNAPAAGSPSGFNRVYGFVAEPTYSIYQALSEIANGVGLVICPGGAYREVWLDWEGHDPAIWLKSRGVTSLVLK